MRKLAMLLLALAALAAGCGGGSKSDTPTIIDGFQVLKVIPIHATGSSLTPSATKLSRFGFYGIEVTNDGSTSRALEFKGPGIDKHIAAIAPGKTAKVAVNFQQAGAFKLFSPDEKSMTATITVH